MTYCFNHAELAQNDSTYSVHPGERVRHRRGCIGTPLTDST